MHSYHVDFDIRRRLYLIAAVAGIGLAWLFHWLVVQQFGLNIPWWVESPSVLAFSGFVWWLIDNYVWKIPVLKKIEWLYIPNLSGRWAVDICSSYSGFAQTTTANALVHQTASRISIAMEGTLSRSCSVLAALIRTERESTFELIYLYKNEPKVMAVDSMNAHSGTCLMRIADDLSTLEGEYYSGRGRKNVGTIVFRRIGL